LAHCCRRRHDYVWNQSNRGPQRKEIKGPDELMRMILFPTTVSSTSVVVYFESYEDDPRNHTKQHE
jgi:hypothetical protein